ncbi:MULTISPECIES: DUF3320 domain-containing protein [unclassified Thiocapsa]|uniref:DUF3320 domain-containing protein n=1 Tax=unclassified Thiocapsa TaxID=2641286 RepID=UPI0035B403AE
MMDQTNVDVELTVVDGDVPAVELVLEVASKISFATHQCDAPVVVALCVRSACDRDLDALRLRLVAEPPVLAPRTWSLDRLGARQEIRVRDRRVQLAGGLLDGLTERMRLDLRLELLQGEAILASLDRPIIALARNEWGGAATMPELLGAFVMPNDPAVARLLKDAARALEASGRKATLEGYQEKSRKRVWELLAGLWSAVGARRLTYAEPPASFETAGQKVRTPSDIEVQGLATCLDLALLFAAAIEQIGLNPLIVFTKGHAFCGAWLQPQTLPTLTVDDPAELRKAIDQQELVLFETTLAAVGHAPPFAKAVAQGRRRIDEEHDNDFVYALDIKQARGRQIQPLTSIVSRAESSDPVLGAEMTPPVDIPPDLPGFDLGIGADPIPETPAERIDLWKRKLLDLTKRNRLLNLRPSTTAIPIFCPDPAALEDRIARGQRIGIVPPPPRQAADGAPDAELHLLKTGDDLSETIARDALERNQIIANTDSRVLEKGVLELFRKARSDLEEGGSNTLFLALGALRWRPPGETARHYRAPLILLPVRLVRKSAASKPFLLGHDDETVFNLTLIEMLRQEFDVNLSDLAGALPSDEHGVDVRQVWNLVRARVREVPGFEVVEEVTLSTFSFAKYLMWKDLADRTDALKGNAFVRHLIETPREAYQGGARFIAPREIDERIDPAALFAPLNADSVQIVAIHASSENGDFVLEGPPGTGKSETIGNIIAHNLACGRRVLFVSEKMAALDVVYRRLKGRGLGAFCLELHSNKANKREVLQQLGNAWDSAGEKTAETWHRKAETLRQTRDRLNGLVHALHEPGPAGISPRDAIGRTLRWRDLHPVALDWGTDLRRPDRAPTPEALAAQIERARRLGQAFSRITPADRTAFSWIGREDWSFAWQEGAIERARATLRALNRLREARGLFAARTGLAAGDTLAECAALVELAALLPRCVQVDVGYALAPDGKATLEALDEALRSLADHREEMAGLPAPTRDTAIETAPAEEWRIAREAAAQRFWPMRVLARRRLRGEIRAHLAWPNKLPAPENAIETILGLQERMTRIARVTADLPARTPWRGLDTDLARASAERETGVAARAGLLGLAGHGGDLVALRGQLRRLLVEGRDLLESGLAIPAAASDLIAAFKTFTRVFESFRAEAVVADEVGRIEEIAAAAEAVTTRAARLNYWCGWIAARRDGEAYGLGPLIGALEDGLIAHEMTTEIIKTAYCRWAAPLMIDERPELRTFSAVQHEGLIATFRALDRELADITADYIRASLSEAIPRKDAPQTPKGLGVLARELQKKTRHKPIRQLIGEMGDGLLTLTPCLMMSPLSVAQFLPADQALFDLVVFDEASQITVPDAIGAIARGRRVIVVGDPKQMPPTSFFDKAADDDDQDAGDLESILDEALAARAPHHRLTGHYRSRHESLIAFSNHAYYDASLVTYPAADTRDSAISLRRVNGIYAKGKSRTNPIEAQELVAEILRRLRDPRLSHLSIGVVTLNSEQQRLVEDLLDQARRADPDLERFFGDELQAPVFVKNLETVQGDQRDVIMLSIAYGPTEPGARTLSMNFGPLNRQGGERRLNVAITRATTEVMVFASFGPEMIDLTRTSARAVQDLKHYLEFAERGPAALGAAISLVGRREYDSDFEMAVAEGLRRYGWDIRTQIGVSKFRVDLGVVHPDAPGRFLAGIESDGATYHSSPSARDRDRVRHIILEQLGWRLLRLWSTDVFLDPAASLEGLDTNLRGLLEADRAVPETAEAESSTAAPVPPAAPMAPPSEELGGAPAEQALDGLPASSDDLASPFEVQRFARGLVGAGDTEPRSVQSELLLDAAGFYDPDYAPTLRALVTQIIEREAPVTLRRITTLVARAHGFQRTGSEIVRVCREAVLGVGSLATAADGQEVVWSREDDGVAIMPFRGLSVDGVERDWSDVPYPEKLGLAQMTLGQDAEDPVRAMAHTLGIGRLGAGLRAELQTLLSAAGSD